MEAHRCARTAGMTFLETSYVYAGGATMRFLADFIGTVPRESLFITVKIEQPVRDKADVGRQLDAYLRELSIDHADALLLHTPSASAIPLLETYGSIAEQVEVGKVRYISASNLGITDPLQILCRHHQLFSLEGLCHLECKMHEDVGLLDFCAAEGIIFVAYMPLRLDYTAKRNYPLLLELSDEDACAQNQVILSWIIHGKGFVPIVKAGSVAHVRENIKALDLELEQDHPDQLNRFRNAEFDDIAIDWSDSGHGVPIYRVASKFS